jgi:hypothetical protein
MKASMSVLVASKIFEIDSVEGQRSLPSDEARLDLLKVVGSKPARLAKPEAESPFFAARESIAFQIRGWDSISKTSKKKDINQ